jgi:hypothetical protein
MIMILGKPLFIWFGIIGFSLIIVTAVLGFLRKFKQHIIFAILAIIFLMLHVISVLMKG